MDLLADQISNAERENAHDRPKDSLSLVCSVLVAQHAAIADLTLKCALLLGRLDKIERDNPSW